MAAGRRLQRADCLRCCCGPVGVGPSHEEILLGPRRDAVVATEYSEPYEVPQPQSGRVGSVGVEVSWGWGSEHWAPVRDGGLVSPGPELLRQESCLLLRWFKCLLWIQDTRLLLRQDRYFLVNRDKHVVSGLRGLLQ